MKLLSRDRYFLTPKHPIALDGGALLLHGYQGGYFPKFEEQNKYPDGLVGCAYVEVALQGDGNQGIGAAGEGNLKRSVI